MTFACPPAIDVAFVTLNYKRSLEHFFYENIEYNCFDDIEATAHDRLDHIPIVHLYGSLGDYPGTPYGSPPMVPDGSGSNVVSPAFQEAAKKIQIISDDFASSSDVKTAQDLVRRAENIVFLGLSYDPRTLELLFTGINRSAMSEKELYGTAVKLPDDRRDQTYEFLNKQLVFIPNDADASASVATLFGHAWMNEALKADILLGPEPDEEATDPFRQEGQ